LGRKDLLRDTDPAHPAHDLAANDMVPVVRLTGAQEIRN